MNNIEWFREAKYGMMVHFGLYSMLAGEYRGRRTPYDYGEWIQSAFAIPNREMEQLAGAFNPVYFNAEEWVKLAKECGMTYFVVTSKHHEGFALFDSDCDAYNIKKATPFGRDLIAELAEACYKHGLKLGLYYSQELDWHHPHGGGYDKTTGCAGTAWYNNWDFPGADNKDYSICFNEKIKPQVKEIMTKYGDICLIWFDTPGVMTKAQSQELYDLVKQYQPDCLVNSRLGNGVYDYVSLQILRPQLENTREDPCKQAEAQRHGGKLPFERRSRCARPYSVLFRRYSSPRSRAGNPTVTVSI